MVAFWGLWCQHRCKEGGEGRREEKSGEEGLVGKKFPRQSVGIHSRQVDFDFNSILSTSENKRIPRRFDFCLQTSAVSLSCKSGSFEFILLIFFRSLGNECPFQLLDEYRSRRLHLESFVREHYIQGWAARAFWRGQSRRTGHGTQGLIQFCIFFLLLISATTLSPVNVFHRPFIVLLRE